MDTKRKKELLQEWKDRRPEMGVISIHCNATGETFLGSSKDTRADFNSNRFKLTLGGHPNKHLQELWNVYGESSFDFSTIKILKYENPQKDHTEELEKIREQCLTEDTKARKIWK
ncbi:GIY-YIG nuclease family protein [Hespellia stercorisuis]|uniref:GIY-YIG nuclease family protein n=1 Tax=Hespellia stercorisuis DSM 15480 TaxID=1121950 RepID=A0A1M6KMZ5_9FIRM|nr:GIY-YIG nuclease family protein [Hespellia stercorisuis]SHJ60280.1 hypothetical protein SAMN02745243_00962 [Hespellia stercorisuis DSM 15480]